MRAERTSTANVKLQGQTCAEAVAKAQRVLQQATQGKQDAAIRAALAVIGTAWQADRAYVFEMRDMVFICNTHEWCAPGIAPAQSDLQQIPYNVAETFWTAFRDHGALHLHDIEAMPVGSDLRHALVAQQIKSLIAVALWDGPEIIGFVGVDFCQTTRALAPLDIPLLQSFATTLCQSMMIDALRKDNRAQKSELRIVQERIAAIIHALPELLVEVDRSGLVVSFHQSPHMQLALSPVEIVGQPPEAFLPPHVARICRAGMAQVDLKGWSQSFDYSLPIDGQERRFSLYVTGRGTGSRGRSKGYLFVVRDMTDDHQPDGQDRLLARMAELSSNLIILTDAQRRISWMNPAGTERTGYSLDDAMGRDPVDLLGLAKEDPTARILFDTRMDTGGKIDAEFSATSRTGMPFWVKLSMRPLTDDDGSLQGFMIIGNDVTMQKLAETRALQDRAEAMDALPEGIALIQRDGRCAYLNPALRTLLDLPADTPTTWLSWHDISPEPFSRQLVDMMPQLYAEGACRREFTWSKAPDCTLFFDISISVQDDGGFLFIARDITPRKVAEREQALLREQVQVAQSRQLVAQLASGLAHDVANVLSVIGHVTASMKLQQSTLPTEALARIDEAACQAQALMANLSHLGRNSTRPVRLDLRPVIEQAADLVRPSLGAATRFRVSLPDSPIEVMADTTSIMQVILNLVLNARDALVTDQGRTALIALDLKHVIAPDTSAGLAVGHVQPGRAYACLRVCDTGIGLAPETATVMFNPYVSTKGDKGIGLGLSIVAEIIRRAQGAIRIDSTQGAGTCFEVLWPIADTDPRADETQSGLIPKEGACLHGAKILLVDDDDDVLRETSMALSAAGAEVASCIDPRDALEALQSAPDDWNIVITDHDMGPMTGIELAEQIAQVSENLPIILVSGAKHLKDASESVHPAVELTLQKPVSANVLVAVVLDLLLRRPSRGPSETLTNAPSDSR